MRVVSLFDGIGGTRQALKELGADVETYYASEIDEHAQNIVRYNFPDTKFIGDVKKVKGNELGEIDLMTFGSPCQDLSKACQHREGLEGDRSALFFEAVRLLEEIQPKYFLMENVESMSDEDMNIINKTLGVHPIMINSKLVSAQNRERFYWTNIAGTGGIFGNDIDQPADRKIYFKDIIEQESLLKKDDDFFVVNAEGEINELAGMNLATGMCEDRTIVLGNIYDKTVDPMSGRVYGINGKSTTLKSEGGGSGAKMGLYLVPTIAPDNMYTLKLKGGYKFNVRRAFVEECERLQTFPDNYTKIGKRGDDSTYMIPKGIRYKTLGNAFTVAVIKHLLQNSLK